MQFFIARGTAAASLVVACVSGASGTTVLFSEDFETDGNGTRYTTSTAEFSDGSFDYFTRTKVGDGTEGGTSDLTGNSTFFFAASDIDGEGADSFQTLTFSGIDVSGFTELTLSMDVAESDGGTNPAWDEPDIVHASFIVDGVVATSFATGYAIWFDSNPVGDTNSTNQPVFTNYDFDADGGDSPEDVEITTAFSTISRELGFSGASTVDLVISFDLTSGSEDFAIDNILLTGVPEPTSLALIGLGGLAMFGRRLRRA